MTRQKKPTRRKTLICDLTEECDQKDYPPKKGQPAKEGHLIKAAEGNIPAVHLSIVIKYCLVDSCFLF